MLKKTLCLLLCIATTLCFPIINVSADTSYTKDVSSVNGTRYTDYLVIYTSAYGSSTSRFSRTMASSSRCALTVT